MQTKIESTGFAQIGKIASVIFDDANYDKKVELQLGDYELKVCDGKTYAVKKKPEYPTIYAESYREDNTESYFIHVDKDELSLYGPFIQLIRCRNVYWKAAGEQMGLDKPWEPDWNDDDEDIFCIYNVNGTIYSDGGYPATNKILVFPTEEMRDAFYENFKDLIEQCKELL